MLAFADAVEANREEVEKLQTMEQGKPLTLAQQEVSMTLTWLRTFAKMEVKDEVIEETDEKMVYSTFPPLGVCGAIVPWNWPILLGLGKVGPALMTGNAIIMKPSPFTPYCDLKLGEIGMSIFPPGVFQVLSGDDSLGPWMTSHPGIDMITFTGSIPTGKRVAESCAKTLKRCVLELGGNDAAIVCDDVDIEKCMPKIATLAFLNSGQICMLVKRIYVHEKIYGKFRDAMVEFTKSNIKTGGGFESDVIVGPVQNKMQYVAGPHPRAEQSKKLTSQIQPRKADVRGDRQVGLDGRTPRRHARVLQGLLHRASHHRQPARGLAHRAGGTLRPHRTAAQVVG